MRETYPEYVTQVRSYKHFWSLQYGKSTILDCFSWYTDDAGFDLAVCLPPLDARKIQRSEENPISRARALRSVKG